MLRSLISPEKNFTLPSLVFSRNRLPHFTKALLVPFRPAKLLSWRMEDHACRVQVPFRWRREVCGNRRRGLGIRANTLLHYGLWKPSGNDLSQTTLKIFGDRTLDEIPNTRLFAWNSAHYNSTFTLRTCQVRPIMQQIQPLGNPLNRWKLRH